MKRFTITGKKVFRDNQEGVFYVLLNDDTTMIQVENNPEDMAVLAWNQSDQKHRLGFLKRNFHNQTFWNTDYMNKSYDELPLDVKTELIAYQKSKMEIKA